MLVESENKSIATLADRIEPTTAIRRLAIGLIVWFLASLFVTQVTFAFEHGSELSEIVDTGSEASVVRAGQGFAEQGFLANGGFGDIGYGNQFPQSGGKVDKNLCPTSFDKCIYFHEPSGGEWTVGLLTKIFGVGKMPMYRLAFIVITFSALSYLAWALCSVLGAVRTALVFAFLHGVPMLTNAAHGLYHSGEHILFIVQLAFCIRFFRKEHAELRRPLIALGLIAFGQGLFTFEYIFVTTLMPLLVALLFVDIEDKREWRRVGLSVVVCGGAYGFALILHFIQIAHYLGGYHALVEHFTKVFHDRSSGNTWYNWDRFAFPGRFGMVSWFFLSLMPAKNFFDGNFVAFIATALALVGFWSRAELPLGRRWALRCKGSRGALLAIAGAVLAGCGWIVVMPVHAAVNSHFTPRTLFIIVMVAVLAVAKSYEIVEVRPIADAEPAAA